MELLRELVGGGISGADSLFQGGSGGSGLVAGVVDVEVGVPEPAGAVGAADFEPVAFGLVGGDFGDHFGEVAPAEEAVHIRGGMGAAENFEVGFVGDAPDGLGGEDGGGGGDLGRQGGLRVGRR